MRKSQARKCKVLLLKRPLVLTRISAGQIRESGPVRFPPQGWVSGINMKKSSNEAWRDFRSWKQILSWKFDDMKQQEWRCGEMSKRLTKNQQGSKTKCDWIGNKWGPGQNPSSRETPPPSPVFPRNTKPAWPGNVCRWVPADQFGSRSSDALQYSQPVQCSACRLMTCQFPMQRQ